MHRVIYLQPEAPPKPAAGEPCVGCGVCCATDPCPLGALLSGRTRGACAALRWVAGAGVYRCGVLEQPADYLPRAAAFAGPLLQRVATRLIAAGAGCDCTLEVETPG